MQILSTKGKRGYILEAPLGSGIFFTTQGTVCLTVSLLITVKFFLCDLIVECLHCFKHGAQ